MLGKCNSSRRRQAVQAGAPACDKCTCPAEGEEALPAKCLGKPAVEGGAVEMYIALAMICAGVALAQAGEKVGQRPYELVWAGRTQDDHPPLVDFEDLRGWRVETVDAAAKFERTREQQIWGRYVGKLTYRATGRKPVVVIRPPEPVAIQNPFDAVTVWIYGNNWAWVPDPTTPQVEVRALFQDSQGQEVQVSMTRVRWREWFLVHRRLTPEQQKRLRDGAKFSGFMILNGRNTEDRVLYFDNLAVFVEEFPPLKFKPRPRRGIEMLPGQGVGTNTGPGKLPFPTRQETILPDNLTKRFTTTISRDGQAWVFTYVGDDGRLTYRLEPKTGMLDDISARWEGRGGTIHPCVGGGVYLAGESGAVAPEKAEHLGTQRDGDMVVSRWRLSAGPASADVTYRYRIWNKSLVIEILAPGGHVAEVRYGRATGLANPRLVTNPYYLYGSSRPAVVVAGPPEEPLFLAGHTDWCLSNASVPWAENAVGEDGVRYNGGTRYIPRTDGRRNDCYERLFITISPRYEEVLPTIPNPQSPYKHVTGTRVWRAHGAGNREADIQFWTRVHRYGMRMVVVTDHETMWRDGGESFTFRTRAAPKKGGDKGAYDYARVMIDKLGFVYGPYNNFTDFAPVNEHWSIDRVSRTPDNQLQRAWPRCYAPKPAYAVEACEELAPKIQAKFHFNTAYCDVHTAVAPWGRVDYDYRVPGAGTFAAVFYSFGEIMLLQKKAWQGPVYSEGGMHFMYCGLTDGNYAQDQRYNIPDNPWLVDFDLRKLHDLCCNFGMGNPGMFYGRHRSLGRTREEIDASIDRFLAATIAFGHTGFLVFEGGFHTALRSYYMLQQLHSRYALASAEEIRYADEKGRLLDTSAAIATGVYKRSQIVTRYSDGTVTVVNGHPTERMAVTAYGRKLDLPPNGYAGWTEDGSIYVVSTDVDGHRYDYAVTPAYIYIDGRGRFVRREKAAGNGIGICRILGGGKYEVILYDGAECGFAIAGDTAVALDKQGKEIGRAEVRRARGLCYVMPVEGALSYLVTENAQQGTVELKCERDEVVAGERVTVIGKSKHVVEIPADAKPGQRIWKRLEGAWIDFTVVPLAYVDAWLEGNVLCVGLRSNLARATEATLSVAGKSQQVRLQPRRRVVARIDMGEPTEEMAQVLTIEVRAGRFSQKTEWAMIVDYAHWKVARMPAEFEAGMCLRGGKETTDFGAARGYVARGRMECGGVAKEGLRMHPPYVGGVGYSYALFSPLELPPEPAAAFRASVGKGDGSDLGDGILYKVVVVDENGKQHEAARTVVRQHEWRPIEADLSAWAGKTIRLKLISDVGDNDNSIGDWACWADMRIETLKPRLKRRLDERVEAYRREPGPFAVKGLTLQDLRSARRGWLHYDGMGLEGKGRYATYAVLNGVELGNMARAAGKETEGVWAEKVSVPLTAEAIRTLSFRNRFILRNPRRDCFKVRRFWIELELADGRKCSSDISAATFTQPPQWPYAEGILVPFGEDIAVDIWFPR